jgi:penicillin amidase
MNLSRKILSAVLGRRLPVHAGTLRLDGVHSRVRIDRDRWGIPHIQAESEEDAWFAQGFCQGQDRCFQLESLARAARGTISELVGKDGLEVDRVSRRVGFARHARAQFATFEPRVRAQLSAFARGVTLGKTVGLPKRPHEFAILRAEPSAFEPEDTIALLAVMNFLLASNWDAELTRMKVLELDGIEALRAIDRPYPEWLPSALEHSRGKPGERLASGLFEAAEPLLSLLGAGGGSNNWAVSGSRTRTGRPLLANDPHLAPLAPAQWYLSHVKTPGWEIAGAGLIGAPGVASGHNAFAAWGMTAGMIDNTDLFVEEIGADGASCKQGESFVACDVVDERIRVRGADDVVEKVVITPRGPIVSSALEGGSHRALSMKATWLEQLPMSGVLELQRSTDFTEFRNCFRKWPGLSLNFVYADTHGDIGWQLVGLSPKRKPGTGFVPLPGWEGKFDWEGLEPYELLPHVLNPKEGFVATANAKPTETPKIDLGDDWLDGYRLSRIQEELGSRKDWDVESTQRLQMNQESKPWKEIRETILQAIAQDRGRPRAWAILETWDGHVRADSAGAALFELLLHELIVRAVKAKAPASADWVLGKAYTPLLVEVPMFAFRRVGWMVRLLKAKPPGWFEDGWDAEIAASFRAVCAALEAARGPDSKRWRWGDLRQLEFKHPLSKVKLFRKIFNHGPFPWGGDTNTIGQATNASLDACCNPGATPSMRMVVDVGEWESSRFVLPGGQSGNPLSDNYEDLLALWKKGEGVQIAWSEEAVRKATTSRLELLPAKEA